MEEPKITRIVYENKPLDLLLEAIRALVRPILTLTGWLYLCQMVYDKQEIPEFFIALVGGFTAWYFRDRTLKHQKENK